MATLVAAFFLPSCLVTETRDVPPRNQPPSILSAEREGSITTPTDAVFLVAAESNPALNLRSFVRLSIDVEDEDDRLLEARVFVIAPQASTGLDGGVAADGGSTAPAGFERRFVTEQRLGLSLQTDRNSYRGAWNFVVVPGEQFVPRGRCYGVEVRVSSAFRSASNDPNATDTHLPVRDGDLASVLYWVASYGDGDTSVDLGSCPVHTQ